MVNPQIADQFFREILDEREKILERQAQLWEEDVNFITQTLQKCSDQLLCVNKNDQQGFAFKYKININVVDNGRYVSNILTQNKDIIPYFVYLIEKEQKNPHLFRIPLLLRSGQSIDDLLYFHKDNPSQNDNDEADSNNLSDKLLSRSNNLYLIRKSRSVENTYTLLVTRPGTNIKARFDVPKNETISQEKQIIKRTNSEHLNLDYNYRYISYLIKGFKYKDNLHYMPISPLPSLSNFTSLLKMMIDVKKDLSYDQSDVKGSGNFANLYFGNFKGKPVGIKWVKQPGNDLQALDPIYKEFIIQACLTHPNILPILGVGVDDNHALLIMPWINGGSMDKFIKTKRFITDYELHGISYEFALALGYLRDKGVVHRDIGARNLLIKINPLDEKKPYIIMLADFGLSTCVPSTKLENGALRWLSPETYINGTYTYASDVYGFALTMIEILAHGEVPFVNMELKDLKDYYFENQFRIFNANSSIPMDISMYKNIPPRFFGLLESCLQLCGLVRWKIHSDIIKFLEIDFIKHLCGNKIELKPTLVNEFADTGAGYGGCQF